MIRLTDLPDDILEEIFQAMRDIMRFPGEPPSNVPLLQFQEDSVSSYSANPDRKVVPLWANVLILSHVCTHWRELMLYRPRLWTFIRVTSSFSSRIMANEMIERSGHFPLSILFTNEHSRDQDRAFLDLLGIASVIGDHSERIQELGLILRAPHAGLILDSMLSNSRVPRLEKLWLDTGGDAFGLNLASPISLFDTMVPPLRVLHVHRIPIQWLPFEELVHLELTWCASPPLPALLETLRCSPFLQTLILHTFPAKSADNGSQDGLGEYGFGAIGAAMLPCLRQLQLRVDTFFTAAFSVLPYITFPPSTAVRLSFTDWIASGRPVYEDCESLTVLACNVEHAIFTLNGNHVYFASENPSLSVDYGVATHESEESILPLGRLCEGFLAVPLPALKTLFMVIYVDGLVLTHSRLARLFQAIPSLQRLAVNVHPMDSAQVFTALATVVKDEHGNEGVLCPELKEFAITWRGRPSADDFWNLERCCYFRASKGRGLAKLETVPFPPIVQEVLEQSVPSVVAVGYRQ
ncbi:hypothetical protein L226DRAFT_609298 [Lentinus tigrinus ALCF2SS1-7]|uniref:Uncharacterized protein n=1 Tax=Lentinus tigrinus ALCF2SS1-6 TaxID=1328759 RepID=A0A5C2STT3_9APHY|nr:hypothetical protein L227DRAFT_649179 [Lentinus tigrinus ALCF2SS1-6]RPD80392.1 hypothetical protein L226DRAFT_609298 [Lentinus tigrinus ALCF2SS1-7]